MRAFTLVAALAAVFVLGCAHTPPVITESNLTPGMAKRTIAKGATTQGEVLEVFGPPDQVTHRDDLQIWTYDKVRYDLESSSGFLTVFAAAGGSNIVGAGGAGLSGRRVTSSSTSTILILYFDSNDVVQDYRMSTIRF